VPTHVHGCAYMWGHCIFVFDVLGSDSSELVRSANLGEETSYFHASFLKLRWCKPLKIALSPNLMQPQFENTF
jgi:hypothetical protein